MRLTIFALLALMATSAEAQTSAVQTGMQAFNGTCIYCHNVTPDKINGEGPELTDVYGRKAASVKGFGYSPALTGLGAKGVVWTDATLDQFLADPAKMAPGTKMAAGAPDPAQRAALIAYLKSLK